jgi:alpha-glucosidase
MPVIRSLAIAHPFDRMVYAPGFENEILFGPSILVAPVASDRRTARVYRPPGNWYRFSSGKKFSGGAVDVPSPLDNLPVFVKAGAIIPMESVTLSTAAQGDGTLYLHIWYGERHSSFLYYEDDGVSYGYEKGLDYRRLISFRPSVRSLLIGKVQGSYASRFIRIRLILHGFPALGQLQLNGAPVSLERSRQGTEVLQSCTLRNLSRPLEIKW